MSYTAKEFGEKYGKKYERKAKEYGALGYFGTNYFNEETRTYCIHESTPCPFDADKRVSRIQTLWLQLLSAASECRSVLPSMYPKLPEGCFERQLNTLVEAGFIRVIPTESGVAYLEIQPAGNRFMTELSKKEQKNILDKVEKAVSIGGTFLQTFITLWPVLQQYIVNVA